MTDSVAEQEFDVVIAGGGLVGASLAVALAATGKSILVVEPAAVDSASQPSYDERTVALTYSSRNIFTAIGLWSQIELAGAEPIRDIHISNKGHFGQAHLSAQHAGTPALGYVVPTRVIGHCLWEKIEQSENISTCCPATVETLLPGDDHCRVVVNNGKTSTSLESKLVVLADGGRSSLNQQVGLHRESHGYDHSAILCIVSVDRPHRGRAYERFTDQGPLALLPLGKPDQENGESMDRYAVVWTTGDEQLPARMELDDPGFISTLQLEFGDRAGNFSRPSARKAYPLNKSSLDNPVTGRVVAIGNAAHTVHPVAGQGFNLGLRDVAWLAEIIHDCPPQDIGAAAMMNRYTAARCDDTRMVEYFTHSLIEIFANQHQPLSLARNIGLKAIEYCPPAKRFLLKRTMGLASVGSRLALGLPLEI